MHAIAVSADRARVLSGGAERSALLHDVASQRVVRRFGSHRGALHCVALAG